MDACNSDKCIEMKTQGSLTPCALEHMWSTPERDLSVALPSKLASKTKELSYYIPFPALHLDSNLDLGVSQICFGQSQEFFGSRAQALVVSRVA